MTFRKYFSRFASAVFHKKTSLVLLLFVCIAAQLVSCGQKSCNIFDKAFREAGCKNLGLGFNITPKPPAGCSGANWRNLYVHCPASTGANSNCTSIADGFTVVAVLVPNNASGNFTDTAGTGITYTNCSQLLTDVFAGTVAGVLGIYISDGSTGNRLNCDDATGCGIRDTSDNTAIAHTSAGCFANPSTGSAAQLTAGTQVLACLYIDNSPLGTVVPPPVYGPWYGAMPAYTLAGAQGTIVFNNPAGTATWQDAY